MTQEKFDKLLKLQREIDNLETNLQEMVEYLNVNLYKFRLTVNNHSVIIPESLVPGLLQELQEHLAQLKKEFANA